MNITGFAASNSLSSINQQLVRYVLNVIASKYLADARLRLLDLNEYEMPLYRPDREELSGVPEQALRFRADIAQCDRLVISFAEHNSNYTAAYKNLFDWCSRVDRNI